MVHIIDGVQRMLRFAKHSLFASTGFADEPMVRQKAVTRKPVFFPYGVSSILDQPTQAAWCREK